MDEIELSGVSPEFMDYWCFSGGCETLGTDKRVGFFPYWGWEDEDGEG